MGWGGGLHFFFFFKADAHPWCMCNFCCKVLSSLKLLSTCLWSIMCGITCLWNIQSWFCQSGLCSHFTRETQELCLRVIATLPSLFPSAAFIWDYFIVSVTNRPPWIVILYCLFLTAAKILASFFNHEMNCCRNGECYSFLHITFFNQKIVISQMH